MKLEPTEEVRRELTALEGANLLTAYSAWHIIAPMVLKAAIGRIRQVAEAPTGSRDFDAGSKWAYADAIDLLGDMKP